jgi:hypothetical protein
MADRNKKDDNFAYYFVDGAKEYSLQEIIDNASQWTGKLTRAEIRDTNYPPNPRTAYALMYEFEDESEAELHVVTDSHTNQIIRHSLRVLCAD